MDRRLKTTRQGRIPLGVLLVLWGAIAVQGNAQTKPEEKPQAQSQPRSWSRDEAELPGTPVKVKMREALNSKQARNGGLAKAVLAEKVELDGRTYEVGAPATVQVISVAPAGMLQSAGELSVQLKEINDEPVLTSVILIMGDRGRKDLPDSAPEKGTEAEVKPDTTLTFKVMPRGLAWTHDFTQHEGEEQASNGGTR